MAARGQAAARQKSEALFERHITALLKSIGTIEKARDFSKLYPKTIIDKRGRRNTVYVSRDETAETTDANKGRTAILREKLKANLRPYSGLFIKNKHSPVRAYISGNCASKIGSNKAVEKSKANGFTVEQHFEIANRIVPLFRNSYLKETKPDKDGNPNIKSVKRFAANTRLSDGTETKVWITVLEAKVEGHRIYSVELMEIEEAPSAKEGTSGGTVGKSNATAESRKSKQKGKSDFRPVTASATLPQANNSVNKNSKKVKKSKKWLWIDGSGKIWTRKSVLEAWTREDRRRLGKKARPCFKSTLTRF